MPWECREDCDPNESTDPDNSDVVLDDGDLESDAETSHTTYKDDSTLRDQQSTGRKRAARWFPLDETALCEWNMKKNCGGGKFPITGCAVGLQQARHHGPDKNTLNNEKGNVHRICHTCHNRWHTLNDEGYVWADVHNEHEPHVCELQDIIDSEDFWKDRSVVTAKD